MELKDGNNISTFIIFYKEFLFLDTGDVSTYTD